MFSKQDRETIWLAFLYSFVIGIIFFTLAGCAPAPRFEFYCQSAVVKDTVVTNCADVETWREWVKKRTNA